MAAELLRNRLVLSLAGGALLGLLGALMVHDGDPQTATGAADNSWQLPPAQALARYEQGQVRAIREAGMFAELEASAASADEKASTWRLVGIVAGPPPTALVLLDAASEPSRLSTGDPLPDGSRLVAIDEGGIVIERSGCEIEMKLFRDPSPPTCESPDAETMESTEP